MKRPVIGITPSISKEKTTLNQDYINAIIDQGGIPFVFAYKDIKQIDFFLQMVDGILLTGGGDVDPKYFRQSAHEKADLVLPVRDAFELELARKAYMLDKPILAICRGVQVLNVALGGDLIQHIDNHVHEEQRHQLVHQIEIVKDSLLFQIIGQQSIKVNSIHHQAVGKVSKVLSISAYSTDGYIEAIENKRKRFVLGVQWHPEAIRPNSPYQNRIFDKFVKQCCN